MKRHVVMFSILPLLVCALAFPTHADRIKQYIFDINGDSLVSCLDQFSHQTDIQVTADLASVDIAPGKLARFFGRATADEALKTLLGGTDLTYTWLNDNFISVHATTAKPPHSEDGAYEVLVTGSRLFGNEGPAPVRSYRRETIEQFGVFSLPDL